MLFSLLISLWVTIIYSDCAYYGYYDQREPYNIHICNSIPPEEETFAIAHELWHLYMFTQMSKEDIAKYPTQNDIEWFADDFAKFVLDN